jgi:glycosyltransferase involved in cell wall biosynthesis
MDLRQINVVTPVKDDIRVLDLIKSLRVQRDANQLEHTLVFNGSSEAFINKVTRELGKNGKTIELIEPSTPAAINEAIIHSDRKWILVLDSDCICTSDYVSQLKTLSLSAPFLSGQVIFRGRSLVAKLSCQLRDILYKNVHPHFYFPNTILDRDTAINLGALNTDYRYCFDSEFSNRCLAANYNVEYNSLLRVEHWCHDKLKSEISIWLWYGRDRAQLFAEGAFGDCTMQNLWNLLWKPNFDSSASPTIAQRALLSIYFAVRNFALLRHLIKLILQSILGQLGFLAPKRFKKHF